MICIACGKEHGQLAKSHVISNFIRKRLTGELGGDGSKKYSFKWVGRPDYPRQDLPKPELMCRVCDSELGASIESDIASLIMPTNVNILAEWEKLPLMSVPIEGIFDSDFLLGSYDYPLIKQWQIEKFAILTAWRALHAMHKDGESLSTKFLESPCGKKTHEKVLDHLFRNQKLEGVKPADLYYWPPQTVQMITGKDDEIAFAWSEVGYDGEFLGVTVIFGYWVIVWPLFEATDENYRDKLNLLNKICFWDWVAEVSKLLKSG